jgi:hypothetical protein
MLWEAFLRAPGIPVDELARILLTPEEARHPLFAERLDSLREVQIEIGCGPKRPYRKRKTAKPKPKATEAEKSLKTIGRRKQMFSEPENLLKTHAVR